MEYTEEQIKEYKEELRELVKNQPCNFSKTMVTTRKYLMDFVNWMTPLLKDEKYKISTKVYWVLHDFNDFPKCKTCGKPLTQNIIITHGHKHYCNSKCANLHKDVQDKIKSTCMGRYGTEYSTQSEQMKSKAKDTWIRKYGVDNPSKSDEIKVKISNNMHQIFADPILGKALKEKRINANIEKYGVENAFQSEIIKEKCRKTKKERYGNANYSNREKANKTVLEKYGSWNILKHRWKFQYDNHSFDSSYELMYYVWLKDHNIEFIYPCPIVYDYYDLKGKHHTYHPDFLVENKVVEIKGLHFFEDHDPNKRLICPYDKSKVTDDSKWLCMKENKVTILTSIDLEQCFKYIKNVYGKDFVEKCKYKNESIQH